MKMRCASLRSTPIILLLLAVMGAQAGLVHRQIRTEHLKAAASSESLIPVQIIQEDEQLDKLKNKPDTQKLILAEDSKKTALLTGGVIAPELAPDVNVDKESNEKIADTSSVLISEPLVDKVLEQQFQDALAEETKEVLQEEPATAAVLSKKPSAQAEPQLLKQAQEINSELKKDVPAAAEDAAAAIYFGVPETTNAELGATATEELQVAVEPLKSESLIADSAPAESQDAPVAVQALVPAEGAAVTNIATADDAPDNAAAAIIVVDEVRAPVELERQAAATQATPTQTTTQGNFVQQLIQNSPIGQFFGQLTGQPQQQAAEGVQIAADQPATPAPTIPGFLNPQNAITQVQNAAQSVANATAQAFQGVQQFASNLGSQFQNTLSSLGGQPANTADSTTPRPPGPIQSLISNFVGGNPTPAAAAAAAGATQSPAQQQGPLQGIISFFQGGNRPQTAAAGSGGSAAAVAPAPANAPSAQLDNKVDEVNKDEQTNELTDAAPEHEDQAYNEVRNSAEVGGADSLEDNSSGGQYIIVNDDVSQQDQHGDIKSAAAV